MVLLWLSRAVHSLVMAAKYNVAFVLGGPGAGKGTQCAKIVEVRTSAEGYTGQKVVNLCLDSIMYYEYICKTLLGQA